jgi:NADPH:quinone reductase-like Zn-dependent oxidoreductase
VDVVLNSLAGEALRETWHCLAMFGRFVEIGKKDIVGNTGLDMAPFMKNLTFFCVNLVGIYRHNIPLASRLLSDIMDLVHQGVIRPITPITVYPFSQIESAFKLMQLGKHVGKIVLKPSNDDRVPVSSEETMR